MISSDVKYRVIYRDTDKMGVVYHANYIVFYEIARNEMFRNLGKFDNFNILQNFFVLFFFKRYGI